MEDIGESVIREMTRLAIENNAINLAQGITRIEPPERLLDFAVEAIRGDFNSYTVTYGRPQLRKKISEIIYNETGVEFDPESEVLITTGASEGFASSIFSLIEGESSVVIPEPFYESYFPLVALSRGKPIFLKLKKSDYSITKA
ncbi:MAG: aminotransferase class I/II-fold pyridoxal phosphate-dependent enzyme, partial [Candidatus Aminicenantes bacterium]|nr:aminotransferase class I/II-fold pyridoxal phosphate-dependent enzyme [Candidatus Aminicenantes bacterium]